MDQAVDIPYAVLPFRDPYREFDIYVPSQKVGLSPPLICFVHGGAWRSEDKSDHNRLAHRLAEFTKFPVAVPNYRLTETSPFGNDHIRHPSHAEDILQFLTFLTTWNGPHSLEQGAPSPYDPRKIYVMGHSCSAHMLASIFLDTSSITPSLTPPTSVFDAVQAIVMSEGIYDLDLLLASFPAYRKFFVEATFEPRKSYFEFSVAKAPLRTTTPRTRWLVIHSKGDSLVDNLQSDTMYNHLLQLHAVATAPAEVLVLMNMDDLNGEHNAILRGEHYIRIVGSFVLDDHSKFSSPGLE